MTTVTPSPAAPRLILASGSPRRRRLLAGLGLDFEVRPATVDETPRPGEAEADYVLRLAAEKARHDARRGELVLAADTAVVLDGEILGKPADEDDARRMLARLAGREHRVLTGVALHWGGEAGREVRSAVGVEETAVRMGPLSRAEIAWYVATGEPLDKAGAYAVQGLGALFVEAVRGNYSNVVGLPVPLTCRLMGELGWDLLAFRRSPGGTALKARD